MDRHTRARTELSPGTRLLMWHALPAVIAAVFAASGAFMVGLVFGLLAAAGAIFQRQWALGIVTGVIVLVGGSFVYANTGSLL